MDPQSWPFELGCDVWPQVQSKSMQQPRSTSRVPLYYKDAPANAARMHLSPHGRPSFTMADVSISTAYRLTHREASGDSCPGFSRTTTTSSTSSIRINQEQLVAVFKGA